METNQACNQVVHKKLAKLPLVRTNPIQAKNADEKKNTENVKSQAFFGH